LPLGVAKAERPPSHRVGTTITAESHSGGAWARELGRRPRRRGLHGSLKAWVQGLTPGGALTVALVLAFCVAIGDDVTGPDVSFTLLYLVPIGFATWFVALSAGVFLSILSAVASFTVDLSTRTVPLPGPVLAWNLAVQLGTFLALVALLAALQSRLLRERQLARTDPLTHVPNRRAFLELAGVEIERARRTGKPITVAYLDCDDFKVVNDRFGHAQGDALLAVVAATLRGGTRAVDTVARLGGDEFGLLLVDTDGAAAEALLARVRTALAAAMHENRWEVSFSIGAVTFLTPPRSLDEMLAHADQLMYDAKNGGKNAARHEVVQGGPAFGVVGRAAV
jgi:diguanylate cyclase (GGDEF)-like protein